MFKYKKYLLYFITTSLVILFLIELVKYFLIDCSFFGLIYLFFDLLLLFLIIPTSHNYNRYYSSVRISKLIIIIVLGIFSSYFLPAIVLNTMNYSDSSTEYINSIFLTKNIFKSILYLLLLLFTISEFKLKRLFVNKPSKKGVDK